MIGAVMAGWFYLVAPGIPAAIARTFAAVKSLLDNKYYMDRINEIVFAGGARRLGSGLWKIGDQGLIDGLVVNGSARLVGWVAGAVRFVQTGFIYHYAIAMILGIAFLLWFVLPLTR